MTKKKTPICIYPGCPITQLTRGLCAKHYMAAPRRMKGKRVTGKDLERRGLLLPKPKTQGLADELDAFRTGSKVKGEGK